MDAIPPVPPSVLPPLAPKPGEPLKAPAIVLLIIGVLTSMSHLVSLVARGVTQSAFDMTQVPPELQPAMQMMLRVGPFVELLGLVCSLLVVAGAVAMLRLRSWPLALTGAIVACVPVVGSCCCLGLPFGIWALVILSRPEAKGWFAASPPPSPYGT